MSPEEFLGKFKGMFNAQMGRQYKGFPSDLGKIAEAMKAYSADETAGSRRRDVQQHVGSQHSKYGANDRDAIGNEAAGVAREGSESRSQHT